MSEEQEAKEEFKMPTRAWVSVHEAAAILTHNTDHEIVPEYVWLLAKKGKITYRERDARTNEYWRKDCERYKVLPKSRPRQRPRPSVRKQKEVA